VLPKTGPDEVRTTLGLALIALGIGMLSLLVTRRAGTHS
jgi:LPXTG-motif cell wall-anchored protein